MIILAWLMSEEARIDVGAGVCRIWHHLILFLKLLIFFCVKICSVKCEQQIYIYLLIWKLKEENLNTDTGCLVVSHGFQWLLPGGEIAGLGYVVSSPAQMWCLLPAWAQVKRLRTCPRRKHCAESRENNKSEWLDWNEWWRFENTFYAVFSMFRLT